MTRAPFRPAAPSTGPRPARGTGALLVTSALLGLLGTGYLAAAGTSLGRHLFAPDLWFFRAAPALSPHRLGFAPALAATDAALGAWALAWLLAGLALRRGARLRGLVVVASVWSLPLLVGPPLFSPDVDAYTAIGASVHHGVDPFQAGPAAAGHIAAVRGAEPFWRHSPTPYSPPFVLLLGGLSWLFSENLVAVVVALRVLCVAATVGLVFLVRRLAERRGADPRWSVWLGVANPLVLVSGVSAGHNDILMLALVVLGLVLAEAGRPMPGVLVCVAAAGVKVVALAVVLVIAVDHARRQDGWPARLQALGSAGGLGLAGFAALVEACGYGWEWVGNLSVPGRVAEPLTPLTALAYTVDPTDPPLDIVRAAGMAAGALLCLLLVTRLRRRGLVRVTAWVLLTVIVAGPVVWPWYLLWPVALVAVAGARGERALAAAGSIALLFTALPGGQPTLSLLPRPLVDQLVLAVLSIVAVWAVGARSGRAIERRRPAPPADEPVAEPARMVAVR